MGKAMSLFSKQQEAYVMACSEIAKIQTGSPLDRIHRDDVFMFNMIGQALFAEEEVLGPVAGVNGQAHIPVPE